MECCQYFILQKKLTTGVWADTELQSKSFQEILKLLYGFQQQYPALATRIQQRNVIEDRNQGRKTPSCC